MKDAEGRRAAPGLRPEELRELEEILRDRRSSMEGDAQGLQREESGTGSDGSALPLHIADVASDSMEHDVRLGRMESMSDEVREISEALLRISAGTYGLCEDCDKPIPVERLRAIPYARLCIPCKAAEENS